VPIGSPLSPIVADLALMQDLEGIAWKDYRSEYCSFSGMWMTLMTALSDRIDHILEVFSSLDEHFKFTIKIENNNQLNFLDIKLIREEHSFKFDLFYKATFSGRYLNYNSQHHMNFKKE